MSDSFIQASCASAAAVFATTSLYPLEISKARLVTSVGRKGANVGTLQILTDLVKEGGPLELYKGLGSKSMHAVVQTFGYYYIYSFLMRSIRRGNAQGELGTITNLGIGYLAGVGNLVASLPFEVVTMRTQVSHNKQDTLVSTVKALYKEDGVAAFYRGLAASVLLCVNPAIYNTVFDQLKARLLARIEARSGGRRVVALSTVQAFVLGVIAKAIATLLTYPYIRAKMVMQAASRAKRANNTSSATSAGVGGNASAAGEDAGCQCGAGSCTCGDDDEAEVPETSLGVMQHIVRTEGLFGLFKGLQVQLLRSTLSSALMLMAKERVYFYTRRALLALARKDAS